MIFIKHPLKDDIAVYTCDYSFLNFLRCISQSRRKNEKLKNYFFRKSRNEKLNYWKANYVFAYFQANLLRFI